MEYFVNYILPIISLGSLMLSAIVGVYKYIRGKSLEYCEKVLKEVYSPLFQFLIRQDTVIRNVEYLSNEGHVILCDAYILYKNENIEEKINIGNISSEIFMSIRKNINMAIAPSNLLILINQYETILSIRNATRKTLEIDIIKFELERSKIEKLLVKEVVDKYYEFSFKYKYNWFQRLFFKKRNNKDKYVFKFDKIISII